MKMKPLWTVLAIAAMTAGLLVGCGGGEPATDVPAGGQGMEPGMTAPEIETPEAPEADTETTAPEDEASSETEAAPEATTEAVE